MALTEEELTFLRSMVSEPTAEHGWTDEKIQSFGFQALQSDGTYDLRLYAALLWEAKAADSVEMVDVAESGSSREMGQVFQHAKAMAERFRKPAITPSDLPASIPTPQSTKIVRATRG